MEPEQKPTTKPIKTFFTWIMVCVATAFISFNAGVMYSNKKHAAIEQQTTELKQTVDDITSEKEKIFAEKKQIEEQVEEVKQEVKELKASDTSETIVKNVKKYYLLLVHGDERYELRTGGSPSWRYNNPGKILYGTFAKSNGAIGQDGPLAIFPSYDVGINALDVYIFQSEFGFKNLTVEQFVKKFAPAADGYNTKNYLEHILKNSKVKASTVLSTLTVDDRTEFMEALQSYENWAAGNIVIYQNKEDFKKNGY